MAGRPVGRDRAAPPFPRRAWRRTSSPPPERWRAGLDTPPTGSSQPVRELQRNLQRLGARPGPVDGLFGPLTEAAVERFQQAHGLATDGVVGTQTKRRLLAQEAKRSVADTSRTPHTGQLARKSPSGGTPAESATEQIRPASRRARRRPAPDRPASEGTPPELLALLVALAAGALLLALRMYGQACARGHCQLRNGVRCAARDLRRSERLPEPCSPRRRHRTLAARRSRTAVLCSRRAAHPATAAAREAREVRREAQAQTRGVRPAPKARRSAPRAQVAVRARAPPVPRAGGQRPGRAAQTGAARTAGHRAAAAGERRAAVNKHVHRAAGRRALADRGAPPRTQQLGHGDRQAGSGLESLNRDRIASGDPDLLEAGEELRLR